MIFAASASSPHAAIEEDTFVSGDALEGCFR